MPNKESTEKLDRIVAQARSDKDKREKSYRDRALKMYPWICGRCAREFNRENLRELTVHHRDHNHDNNPEDGSNWELLCIYCHDNEHSRYIDFKHTENSTDKKTTTSTYNPFSDLATMLKNNK
jgi:hypothetical protein